MANIFKDINLAEAIKISGYKTIEIKKTGAEGATQTGFKADYSRMESLKLNMLGHAAGVTVDIDINQASLDSETKQRIYIKHNNFSFIFGEFQSDFAAYNLLEYKAQIDGTYCGLSFAEHKANLIFSRPKGIRKKEKFVGNDSQGPFIAAFIPMVSNTEEVLVDNIKQERDKDYKIDYTTGKITFIKKFISKFEELWISYESSNTNYMDNITGYKYQFSPSPSANSEVVFIQKRSSDELANSISQTDIVVFNQKFKEADYGINLELGLSKMAPNILESKYFLGPAGHLGLTYNPEHWDISAYITKLSQNFYTLNSYKVNAGDFLYGANTKYSPDKNLILESGYDYKHITQSDRPLEEKDLALASRYTIADIPLSVSFKNQLYLEDPKHPTTNSKYNKNNIDFSSQIGTIIGKFSLQTGLEKKEDLVSTNFTYQRRTLETGYSISPYDFMSLSLDGTYKETEKQGLEKEGRAKVSSSLKAGNNYSLSGYYELFKLSYKPDKSILNLNTTAKPIKEFDFNMDINRESLIEKLNNIPKDTEKYDANFKLNLYPLDKVSLKLNYIPKIKQTRPENQIFSKKELTTLNFNAPFFKGNTSYVFKTQAENILQTKYYPDYLLEDDIKKTTTHIIRFRLPIIYEINLNTEYENTIENTSDLTATSNPIYTNTKTKKEVKQIELVKNFNNLEINLAYENTNTNQLEPSENYAYEHKFSIAGRTMLLEKLSINPKLSILKTYEDTKNYMSVQPEITLSYPISDFLNLTLRYAILNEYKKEGTETTENLDFSAKSDMGKNLILSTDLLYEKHQNPDYKTYSATAKASLIF